MRGLPVGNSGLIISHLLRFRFEKPLLPRLICDKITPIWFGKVVELPFHSSREVEGPALRNLGNRSVRAGANSGRSSPLLEDERMMLPGLTSHLERFLFKIFQEYNR
jgi:hypothetical protein